MSSTAQAELYIYYKLGPAQAEAALAAFEQARGEAPVRLLQRRDGDAALLTWMEVYGPDVAQAQLVEQRIAAVMAPFAVGARHREAFEALSPAASPAK
ncbi:DUF4936 family protein [Roseateles cavernae]|uniref:DUF4936 family protein n=1 Tax=Roseateles cavernae TaxID=3153578 RepID=UPI0032E452F7